jgi:aminomethyltransferase
MLKRTPLYEEHRAAGARLVPFAGWEMPVQYAGVIEEVRAVRGGSRAGCGLFDVSHMGEALVTGPAALAWLNSLTTNDISRLTPGRAQYSLLLRPDGGILDDILVYQTGEEQYLLVLNASNREKDVAWLQGRPTPGVEVRDISDEVALLAVQGPGAQALLGPLTDVDLASLRRFRFASGTVAGMPALVARTGYTGEDGFELFLPPTEEVFGIRCSVFGLRAGNSEHRTPNTEHRTPNTDLPDLWSALAQAGAVQCGLGARDVLRLEAGNVLYGHEIDEETTPLEAGLEWVVKPEKGAFMGAEALARLREAGGPPRRLVGLQSETRAIPRQGYPIVREGDTLGIVTSGTYSPTLERPIGMGYLPAAAAREGDTVEIVVRGRPEPARIVPLPFYRGKR